MSNALAAMACCRRPLSLGLGRRLCTGGGGGGGAEGEGSSSTGNNRGGGLEQLRLSERPVTRTPPRLLSNVRNLARLLALRRLSGDRSLTGRDLTAAARDLLPILVDALAGDDRPALSEMMEADCLASAAGHYRQMSCEQRRLLRQMADSVVIAFISALHSRPLGAGGVTVRADLNLTGCLRLPQQRPGFAPGFSFVFELMKSPPDSQEVLDAGFVWNMSLQRNFLLGRRQEPLKNHDGSEFVDGGWTVCELNVRFIRDLL